MTTDARRRNKGRRSRGTFLAMPHSVLDHPNFIGLSPRATRLLIDLARQFNGTNNGDLSAAFTVMSRNRGWTSKDQLHKGLAELVSKGWIVLTRRGRRPNVASLYALTWLPIDECGGKLERSPTTKPLDFWKTAMNPEAAPKLNRDPRPADHGPPPHGPQAEQPTQRVPRPADQRAEKLANLSPALRAPSKIIAIGPAREGRAILPIGTEGAARERSKTVWRRNVA